MPEGTPPPSAVLAQTLGELTAWADRLEADHGHRGPQPRRGAPALTPAGAKATLLEWEQNAAGPMAAALGMRDTPGAAQFSAMTWALLQALPMLEERAPNVGFMAALFWAKDFATRLLEPVRGERAAADIEEVLDGDTEALTRAAGLIPTHEGRGVFLALLPVMFTTVHALAYGDTRPLPAGNMWHEALKLLEALASWPPGVTLPPAPPQA